MDVGDTYERLRPQLLSLAYRMLGSVTEAEDVVQDAFVRLQTRGDDTEIESAAAYLTTITTRLAIDHLRLARVSRERYIGPWLPEPLLTDPGPRPDENAVLADTLSMALLTVLERLSATERAVFLLHEAFHYSYDEIGQIIDKSEQNCRQIAARARRHIGAQPRFSVTPGEHQELTDRFVRAARAGDLSRLEDLLSGDVVVYSDGGGVRRGALRPVYGRDKAARLIAGVVQREAAGMVERPTWVNGEPGLLLLEDGAIVGVVSIDFAEGLAQTIRVVLNPEKLRHLKVPESLTNRPS